LRPMLRTTTKSAASPFLPARRDDCGMHGLASPRPTTSALVVDSDRFHAGFMALALADEGYDPVRQARTAKEALMVAADLDLQLVLVGSLPDQSVGDCIRDLASAQPAAVILVTGEPDSHEALTALAAGARGIVSKQLALDAFTAVVRAAILGRAVIVSEDLAAMLSSALPSPSEPALSRRELEVLALLVRGWDNAAIAAELHISPSTAKGHVARILEKLDSENRIDAAVQGIRRGLVRL
jgi:DNA-binding NarL/FixJ family response regulator